MREQSRIVGDPEFVPYVVINEKPDTKLANRLVDDFKGTICELINNAASTCKTTYTVILVE